MIKVKLLILLLWLNTANSLISEYYEELIKHWSSSTESYKPPLNNNEFIKGLESKTTKELGLYDFIIVGAGSSGSVLATRLSEIQDFKILLLEAGVEENDYNQILAFMTNLQFSPMNWGYYTTSQEYCCLGMNNKKCNIPRGKAIGGSSAINGMMYVRGNQKDYNKWEEMGNPGWSYDKVLPYFLKSENSQVEGDEEYHAKGGFWNTEYALPPSEILPTFFKAHKEMNVSKLDYNGESQFGVSQLQYNTKRGQRQSSGRAFLDCARQRKNLKVITRALVTKVIINSITKTAVGVEFVTQNEKFTVTAKREVIVSAGAFNSPQILMLSGVGPKNHLEKLGIKVIADLPVGKNLMEHPLFPYLVFRTNKTIHTPNIKKQIQLYLKGLGPFTRGYGAEGIGFIQTEENSSDKPNIEYLLQPPGITALKSFSLIFNYNQNIVNNFVQKINSTIDITILIILLHQKSRGEITLKSSNPIDFPNVNINMLEHKDDVKTIIKGIRFIQELFKTESFKKIDAKLLEYPICTEYEKYSDIFWECIIRQLITTTYHPIGTNSMGPDIANSVVDNNLKVHGIKKLRVIDASIMPSTTSGHTNAPCVMIAEKMADSIKNEYGVLKSTTNKSK